MDGMHKTQQWHAICPINDIVPTTGVAALIDGQQIAIFRLRDDRVFAIGNFDPHSHANVLARGITGSLGGKAVVASPIYKQHFDLQTGECLEAPEFCVPSYRVKVDAGHVYVAC